jgi:putative transposase
MPRRNSRSRRKPGAYHVYNRGRNRCLIFIDDKDRRHFVSLLGRFARLHSESMSVVCFCPMGTHFHLILWQKREGGLEAFMRSLLTAYAKYFNTHHNRQGPLFSGPYRARRLNTPKAFKWAVAYVHDNHRDGVAHPFSSHAAFIDEDRRPPWLEIEPALRVFGGTAEYCRYIDAVAS